MNRNNFVISVLFVTFFIVGCEDKTSVEWYVNHHPELIEKYTNCVLSRSWHDVSCQNAKSAMFLEQDKQDIQQGRKQAHIELQKKLDSGLLK
ncbi:EexN family lipoprotein [Salmonella enterica subsp. enterica]|nr:EexN family lipoprotein [Salmonella enterica subsp. enterica]EDX0932859.1 EexN family lipoprotein [Salmonella enterica subsp. enterica]